MSVESWQVRCWMKFMYGSVKTAKPASTYLQRLYDHHAALRCVSGQMMTIGARSSLKIGHPWILNGPMHISMIALQAYAIYIPLYRRIVRND